MDINGVIAAYERLKIAQKQLNAVLGSDDETPRKARIADALCHIIQAENLLLEIRGELRKQQCDRDLGPGPD